MDVSCPYTFCAPLALTATPSTFSHKQRFSLPSAYLKHCILTAKFSTLRRETAYFFETSRRQKLEYLTLNAHRCENHKVYNKLILLESLHMPRSRKWGHAG